MRTLKHTTALAIVCALMVGCAAPDANDGPRTQGQIIHPTEDNIPVGGDTKVLTTDSPSQNGSLTDMAKRLAQVREVLTLGVQEGESYEMFGRIADVVVDKAGTVYVLDDRISEVRTYDAQGQYIRSIGRSGEGPGEFRAPAALGIDASERLLVLDRARRITAFEADSGTYDTTMVLPFGPQDLCTMASHLFVHGIWAEHEPIVHAFDMGGTYRQSLGEGYHAENEMARQDLSTGAVSCNSETSTVVIQLKNLPVLRGYTIEGAERWVTVLEDFTPLGITEDTETRTITYSGLRGVSDVFHHTIPVAGTKFIVAQLRRRTPESIQENQDYAEIHTYVIDSATGEGVYAGTELPLVFSVSGERAYAAINWPYPRIVVYELSSTDI